MFFLVLVGVLLFGVALAGCVGPSKDLGRGSRNHILILHPPHFDWDDTQNELSGHFILSNIHPDPEDDSRIAKTTSLWIRAQFNVEGEHGISSQRSGWRLDYDKAQPVEIAPGESHVFNFSFPKESRVRTDVVVGNVASIQIRMGTGYTYCCNESWASERNERGLMYVRGSYVNNCLAIENGEIKQKYSGRFTLGGDTRRWTEEGDNCDPWKDYTIERSGFNLMVGDLLFPPPEVWLQWDDDSMPPLSWYPQFKKPIEFLRNFDQDEANLTYFEGEIR